MSKSTKTAAAILVLFAVLVCCWVSWQKRIYIAATIWQIRYRGVLIFAGHRIPVPKNWHVQEAGSGDRLLARLDSAMTQQTNSLHFHSTVLLMDGGRLADIDKWKRLTESSFRSKGTQPTFRNLVTADGETFSCVGGEILPKPFGITDQALLSWHCRSNGNLDIMFTASAADSGQIWELLSRVRTTASNSRTDATFP